MMTKPWIMAAALAAAALPAAAQPVTTREQLNAVLWQQTAVEFTASSAQAYRLAAGRLDAVKRERTRSASIEQQAQGGFSAKPAAVVLDIDETVLDNSAYNAGLLQAGTSYTGPTWNTWVLQRAAPALPGARDFITRARRAGLRVVYITNRECREGAPFDAQGDSTDCPQKAATLDNLEAELGYRPAARDVQLRRQRAEWADSDKSTRRADVAKTHRIAMLLGDDLNDFLPRAQYQPARDAAHWGADWFMLPNPAYGSWERGLSMQARYAALRPWTPPAGSGGLAIGSWNLEWLADPAALQAADFWGRCAALNWPNQKLAPELPFCDVYARDNIKSAADYESRKLVPLRQGLAAFASQQPDLLAVQEVQDANALRAVLPPNWSVACFTTRQDAQNIGFAVRDGAGLTHSCREVNALSLEDQPVVRPVRRGLELSVAKGARRAVLLNVHLKSSCPVGRMDSATNDNCRTLQLQAVPLEAWVEAQAAAGAPFLIIGDWNRDLEAEVQGGFAARNDGSNPGGPLPDPRVLRNLFPEINDGVPADGAIEVVNIDRGAATNDACHRQLDQLVVSKLLKQAIGGTLPAAKLVAGPTGASDHCRIETTLPAAP